MFNILLMNDSMAECVAWPTLRFFTKPRPSAWLPLPSVKRMAATRGLKQDLVLWFETNKYSLEFFFFIKTDLDLLFFFLNPIIFLYF
jgi:hypothetical protein